MKKQSGFTLIELMVVMAIIAILATAGLSAYTGYIKKARDTIRIADLGTINTIVLGQMTTTGLPPQTIGSDLTTSGTLMFAIAQANNGALIKDPLSSGTNTFKSTCVDQTDDSLDQPCVYMYKVCTDTSTYNIAARFESLSNKALYAGDAGSNATLYEV